MIALFAGGGGLHLGFSQEGFQTIFATDVNASAADTFAANLPGVKFLLADVRHLTPQMVLEITANQPVDIIIGGPPCQGFSTLGDQIQGDPRNSLFEAFARIVRWTQPTCFLMENTSYLRSQYSGRYEQEICLLLSSLGYQIFPKTLNAADFGTPQIRKRAFFFGTRLSNSFLWPDPTHSPEPIDELSPYQTVGEAIMDIATLATLKEPSYLPNHIALRHSDKVIARYKLIPEGGRLPPPQSLPIEIRRRNFGNTYKRLHRGRPSLTLVPGNNAFPIHPTEDRSLTAREAARLQDFPDEYTFMGTRAEQCKLVGNAVPVRLARRLAEAISKHIKEGKTNSGSLSGLRQEHQTFVPQSIQLSLPFIERFNARNSLNGISFFTGAGGLLLGFTRAGFNIISSYDLKSHIAENLQNNFPKIPHHKKDVEHLSIEEVLEDIGGRRIDVVFGGPPCQGFSIFGKRRFVNTKGHKPEDDERNELALHYVDLAIGLDPKIILLENVKGLLSTPRLGSLYILEMASRLENSGYQVAYKVVNCADYGVPQLRERLILIAYKPNLDFQWPLAKYFANPKSWQRPYVTVGDVILDLMDPMTHNQEFSHVPMSHKELLVERYKLIPEGGRLSESELPSNLRKGYRSDNIKNYSHVYRRLSRSLPATTLVPGHNAFPVHPILPRSLTVREAARLQTFPDYMCFKGTRQQQCTLVGNAVPPVLAEVFAQAIAKAICGNSQMAGYKADHYELKAEKQSCEYP